jgi:hypothetical protein
MFDAIVRNVLRQCNGCKAGLCVMVEGVGGWGVRIGFILTPGTFAAEILFLK